MVSLLPSCPAMVTIRGVSVTSNLFRQLVRSYTEPQYISYMKEKYQWTDFTINNIAWKCLSLAIQRIDRNVLTTKICNDILPTMHHLYRCGMANNNKCKLCEERETREHMLHCKHPSRTKWKITFIDKLRKLMKQRNTGGALQDLLATALTQWLDTGKVDVDSFPQSFHNAINTQSMIGWMNFFGGRISKHWLTLYETTRIIPATKEEAATHRYYDGTVWGAAIVEHTLRSHIKLWEQRNNDVHGEDDKDDIDNENFQRERMIIEVRRLHAFKNQALPRDMYLFRRNLEEFISQSTTDKLAVYVTSHKRAIKNSVTQWKKQRDSGIHTVTYWLRSHSRENEIVIDNIHTRQRQQMLNGQRHNQQRKRKKQDTTNGATIVDYFQRYTNNQNHYQSTPQNSPQRESRSLLSIRSEVL